MRWFWLAGFVAELGLAAWAAFDREWPVVVVCGALGFACAFVAGESFGEAS